MAESSAPVSAASFTPSLQAPDRRATSTALAFLVHSPQTVENNLPPDVDNKPLARQKRRRTSKEDEDVLKAEYLKNPKPDKAARIEIVRKVALGEKEVQIWFQNKRQNERRRCRPLEASSDPVLMSSSSNMSDPVIEDDVMARENEDEDANEQVEEAVVATVVERKASGTVKGAKEEQVRPDTPTKIDTQDTTTSSTMPSTDPQTVDTAPTELASSQPLLPSSQDTTKPRSAWLADRRSASFRHSEEYTAEVISFPFPNANAIPDPAPAHTQAGSEPIAAPAVEESSSSTRSLRRAHSYVRLSMTADGKARVVTDADQSPSPPHARADPSAFSRQAAGLRRSFSAAGLNDRLLAARGNEPLPKIARVSSNVGRSRDSRAWEFWCDPDTRNNRSLTTQAEQEGSGSAADAIGVIRANRRVLAQNQARQNALSRQGSATALGEHGIKKPRQPMQRASTSYGRLQTKEGKKAQDDDEDELPQTESDKENWEPELQQARSTRPQHASTTPGRARRILGENTDIMSQSSSLGAMMERDIGKTPKKRRRETQDPEQDEELRVFMNSGSMTGRSVLSTAEEAGCVEGLLKLSQGNWR